VTKRALAIGVVIVPPAEIDRVGLHRSNVAALRRALVRLPIPAAYVLTTGRGGRAGRAGTGDVEGRPGGRVHCRGLRRCQVTRDRLMCALADEHPDYGFAAHKGYITRSTPPRCTGTGRVRSTGSPMSMWPRWPVTHR